MSEAELCACWFQVGDEETFCALPAGHEGDCQPDRTELARIAEAYREKAAAIDKWLAAVAA